MGNKTQITFSSEHALEGARKEAKQQGISLNSYIENLVRQDLKEKLQFKIISHYSNGDTREESDFFTENDLTNSAIAYGMLLHRGQPMPFNRPEEVYLTDFEVWKYGKLEHKVEGKSYEDDSFI